MENAGQPGSLTQRRRGAEAQRAGQRDGQWFLGYRCVLVVLQEIGRNLCAFAPLREIARLPGPLRLCGFARGRPEW